MNTKQKIEQRAEELTKLGLLERTLWVSFERSQENGAPGDPRFLQGIMSCIEQRCKLLGLDAPSQR